MRRPIIPHLVSILQSLQEREKAKELTLLQLCPRQLADAVDSRHVPGGHALDGLDGAGEHPLASQRIVGGHRLELDDADAGVLGATVVHAIAQIAQPRLQGGRIVLLDGVAVGDDGGGAGDGGPGAAERVQEGHVDLLGVGGQVHRLVREEVRVEDQVDAAVLLCIHKINLASIEGLGGRILFERRTFPASAMQRDVRSSSSEDLVVSMPNLESLMNVTRSSTFWGRGGSSCDLAV